MDVVVIVIAVMVITIGVHGDLIPIDMDEDVGAGGVGIARASGMARVNLPHAIDLHGAVAVGVTAHIGDDALVLQQVPETIPMRGVTIQATAFMPHSACISIGFGIRRLMAEDEDVLLGGGVQVRFQPVVEIIGDVAIGDRVAIRVAVFIENDEVGVTIIEGVGGLGAAIWAIIDDVGLDIFAIGVIVIVPQIVHVRGSFLLVITRQRIPHVIVAQHVIDGPATVARGVDVAGADHEYSVAAGLHSLQSASVIVGVVIARTAIASFVRSDRKNKLS